MAGCSLHDVPVKPAVIASRLVPSVIVGRFERRDVTGTVQPLQRDTIYEAPASPLEPKTETEMPREVLEPSVPEMRTARLPDEVVMHLIESGRPAFVRCFKKAFAADATVATFKVHVFVNLDNNGAITSATTDTTDPELASCLARATRWLRFPASGAPVAVDLPLFYRVE